MELIIGKTIVILLAIAGFIISYHIYSNKHEKIICFIGHDCDNVVNSKYNKTLGIPNEISGIIYYAFIALIYLTSFAYPVFQIQYSILIISIITIIAVILSGYLTFIQLFLLKEFCTLCLTSSAISALIFIVIIF